VPRVGANLRLRPPSPSSSSPLASTRPSQTCAGGAPREAVSGRDVAISYRCCTAAPVQQETLGASPSPDLSLPLPSRLGSGAVPVREALDAGGSNGAPVWGAVNAAVDRRDGPASAASAARAPSAGAAAPSAAPPRLRRDRPR